MQAVSERHSANLATGAGCERSTSPTKSSTPVQLPARCRFGQFTFHSE